MEGPCDLDLWERHRGVTLDDPNSWDFTAYNDDACCAWAADTPGVNAW